MLKKTIEISHSFDEEFVKLMYYISGKYDEEIFLIQGISCTNLDIVSFSKDFFKSAGSVADISIDDNANINEKSIIHYNQENSKSLMKLNYLYLLHKYIRELFTRKEADKAIEYIINGTVFVNDLQMLGQSYCFGFDLTNLLTDGMSFFSGNMKIKPPKRSESFLSLVIQSTAYISNQISGAIAYPNFFLILNYFYEKEFGDDYRNNSEIRDKIENQFQNIIYSFNFPFRSTQSSFVNLSILDRGFLASLFGGYVFPDGTKPCLDNTYSLSKWFFEYYNSINGVEGIFTFPVLTLAISLDEKRNYIDEEFVKWCAASNCEKSLANIFISEPISFSSCCRLINNFHEVNEYQNSFGVGGISVGSVRVCGINLPRLNYDKSLSLEDVLESIHKVLFAQRTILQDRINGRVMPLYTHNWMSLKRQYSTIGFIGAYEFMLDEREDLDESSLQRLHKILLQIESKSKEWQKEDGFLYNIEQIPGESMAVRLAKIDRIMGYQNKYRLYSNQYISLMNGMPIYERFKIQGMFDSLTSGGAILHLNIDEDKPLGSKTFYRFIETARQTGTKYFGVNYCFSKCEKGCFNIGKNDECSICGSPITDRYTRVVGFLTNVKHWNKVRRDFEFPNRVFYSGVANDTDS